MDRFDDDTLFAELRELRPSPRPEFASELDERAAAGFPRRPSRASVSPFAGLVEHLRDLRGMTARQWLVPAVAAAIVLLAAATAVVAISNSGGHSSNAVALREGRSAGAGITGGGAEEAGEAGGHAGKIVPKPPKVGTAGKAGGGELPQFEAEPAESFTVPNEKHLSSAGGAKAAEEEAFVPEAEADRGGGYSAKAHGRDIERSASVALGTKPGEVAGAAAKVYAAVHAANGVVLHSSVDSGSAGATGASFSLLIPSRKLDGALAAFSEIAEVRSRHDGTDDITAPTVGVTEELRDSNASIEGLLKELGNVETEAERESVEARLREERRRHAAIRASLERLHKRASMSEVRLTIVTGHGAGVVPPSEGGDWSVGDALHDAGHILTIAAGVLLVALAVLAPIALILLLAWLANRFRVRRLRERALG